MNTIPGNITQLAFGKSDEAALTSVEQGICDEWTSGKANELMKVDGNDSRFLEYCGLLDKLNNKNEAVWESVVAVLSLLIPVQE